MLDINELKNNYQEVKVSAETSSNYLENFVKMPEGKGSVVLRILPPAPDGMFNNAKNPFFQATRIHKVNGKSLHDPRSKINGKWVGQNPIGDYLRWLWKESEQAAPAEKDRMQRLYRELKPIERYYYNVIVRTETDDNGGVKQNVGPKILSVGKTVHEAILRGICGDKEMNQPAFGDVTDFKSGRDFKLVKTIKKSGDSTYPNYEGSHFLEESPAGNPDDCKKWMENLRDLAALRVLKPTEELENELLVHLGLKQEISGGSFDPSRFQSPKSADEVELRVEDARPPVIKEVVSASEEDDEEDMADKDFLEELRKLS